MNPTIEKYLTPISVVLAGVLIGGAVLWGNTHPSATPTPGVATTAQQPTAPVVDASKVKTAGEPFIGNPNAHITIAYWFDYQCPFCKQNEQTVMPQIITDYVNTGKAKIVFKDFEFLGPDSQTLGQTGRAVWEVAPDKFYQWHKAVYDNSGTENTGWATPAKIRSITEGVLGVAITNQVLALAASKGTEYQKAMDADKAEGSAFGINGTPGFIIGKQLVSGAQPYAQLKAAIDAVK